MNVKATHVLGLSILLTSMTASATAVHWTGTGSNGHWYEARLGNLTWNQAQANAVAAGGYLATITSSAENNFTFSLVQGNSSYWFVDGANNMQGPWLGGFQPAGSPEPSGGWSWVSGETWSYTAWSTAEPNNSGGEDSLQFFGTGTSLPTTARWNDVAGTHSDIRGYIVEYNADPTTVPIPAAVWLFGSALAGLGIVGNRRSDNQGAESNRNLD